MSKTAGERYAFDTPAVARHGVDEARASLHRSRGFFENFLGLMGVRSIEPGEWLMFDNCSSIHMFFMRIPIDVVWLRDGTAGGFEVAGVSGNVRPWRLAFAPRGAHRCIECAAGTAPEVGSIIEIEGFSRVG